MEYIEHQGGLIEFPNLVDIDPDFLEGWMTRRREFEPDDYIVDDDGNYVNRGGYAFTPEQYRGAPSRFLNLYPEGGTEEDAAFAQGIEDAIYEALLTYMEVIPEAKNCLWWKTSAHVASYKDGQSIGSHHDRGIEFNPQSISFSEEQSEQMGYSENSLHNEVTAGLVLKKPEEGGDVVFKHCGDTTVMASTGTLVLYPSNFVGSHEVLPTTEGERISFLQFFCQGIPGRNVNAIWLPGREPEKTAEEASPAE